MTEADTLILIGGGGHALVVAEAAELAGLVLGGFLDDVQAAPLSAGPPSCARLGGFAELALIGRRPCTLAIGDLTLRRRLIANLRGVNALTIIHPRAIVSPSATIGQGVYIGPGAVVHTRAVIDDHAIINSGSIVEHEVFVGQNVHIAPGAVVGGRVNIGADTLVGIGSRALPGLSIGRGCVIAAGAAVVGNVPDGMRVAGVPAKALGEGIG